jgi:hypothetical protein
MAQGAHSVAPQGGFTGLCRAMNEHAGSCSLAKCPGNPGDLRADSRLHLYIMLSLFASGCGLTIPAPAPAPAVMMRVAASPVMPAVAEVDNIFPTSFTLAAGMSDGGSRKVITSFESELDAFEAKQKVADQAVAERKAALKAREAQIEAEAAAKAAKQAEMDEEKAQKMSPAAKPSKYGEVQKVNKQADRSKHPAATANSPTALFNPCAPLVMLTLPAFLVCPLQLRSASPTARTRPGSSTRASHNNSS